MLQSLSLRSLRWTARILGLLCVGLVLAFAFGEGLRVSSLSGREALLFVFFPVGVCLGMILGWWREGAGGAVTLASLVGFYLVHLLVSHHLPHGFAFGALALPGLLFFIYGLCTRRARQASVEPVDTARY